MPQPPGEARRGAGAVPLRRQPTELANQRAVETCEAIKETCEKIKLTCGETAPTSGGIKMSSIAT
jgi:hypothetical protein